MPKLCSSVALKKRARTPRTELLGKPSPVPTLFEARAEPQRAMVALQRAAAAAGQLKLDTLQTSADLAPLRGRADFRALLSGLRSPAKLPAH